MTLLRMVGAAVAIVASTSVPAQSPPGNTGKLLRGVCVNYFRLMADGNALAEQTKKYGFKANYASGKVTSLVPPAAMADAGWALVSLDPARPACSLSVEQGSGSKLAEAQADIDAWAAANEAGWRFRRVTPAKSPSGSTPKAAWESDSHRIIIVEYADVFAGGAKSLEVRLERKPE